MSSETSEPAVTLARCASGVIAGKYRIDGVLAEGGMGIVYRGWHLTLELPIAIKVMRLELASQPDSAMRFLNEARSAARLRGQHIARVLDTGTLGDSLGGGLYMVMELLNGSDLRRILDREGRLPPHRAIQYVLGACNALSEVHAAGIVHRDVKPDNLFLTRESGDTEVMKLLDFGISKSIHEERGYETREGLGSPRYMSPEQLTNAAEVDARADIWSLGVVLYELLAGRAPFQGENVARICTAVMDAEPEPLGRSCPHVSPALEAIVLRCLSKRPEDRFRTIHDLSLALRALACVDELERSALGSCAELANLERRHPAQQPDWASVSRRRSRLWAQTGNWKRPVALGAAALAIASGIPLSALLDALAARGSTRPAAGQPIAMTRVVAPPASSQSGPVVCPVLGQSATDGPARASQCDTPARPARLVKRTPVSADHRRALRRSKPASRADAATPSRPSAAESGTPWPSPQPLIPLYGSELGRDAEPEPDWAASESVLSFADIEPET